MTARFDWAAKTIDRPPGLIADALLSELPGAHGMRLGRGMHGYNRSMSVLDSNGDVLARILHESKMAPPHAFASGQDTPAFVDCIRKHWPNDHYVTRLDSCRDVFDDFEEVKTKLQLLARLRRVKGLAFTPDRPEDGASYIMGSPSSPNRLRWYQKGLELRSKGHEVPEELLAMNRAEVQTRPVRDGRYTAAHMSAQDVWGVTSWTAEIARDLLSFDPGRTHLHLKLLTTWDRRSNAVVRQFGMHLHLWQQQLGGWLQLGDEIERRLGVKDRLDEDSRTH